MSETSTPEPAAATESAGPNTLLNALIGAGVAVIVAFLPFSTILGGAVAGYLQGSDLRAGAVVGALAGMIALVPIGLVVVLITVLFSIPGGLHGVPIFFVVFLLIGLFVLATYTIGLGALGGVIGAYINRDVEL